MKPDFRIKDEILPEVFVLEIPKFTDSRGFFLKTFNEDSFSSLGLDFSPAESFLSLSKNSVIRGMHFQTGKYAHKKFVSCVAGEVLDVIVSIDQNSKYFNKPVSVELSSTGNCALLIGKGYAHGFLAQSHESLMFYSTSTVHNQSFDKGVLWSSIDFDWPIKSPIISDRDSRHPSIIDFK